MESDSLGLHLTLLYTYTYSFISTMQKPIYTSVITYLNINLVTAEDNRNVLTDTDKITMPVRNVLISDTRSDVKHDDSTLALDTVLLHSCQLRRFIKWLCYCFNVLVTITKTTKLLLTSSVPSVENNRTKVGVESERMNFDAQSSYLSTCRIDIISYRIVVVGIVADAARIRMYRSMCMLCMPVRVASLCRRTPKLTDVFLLEFTSQMALDKSGLASTTVTNYALGQMSVNYEM